MDVLVRRRRRRTTVESVDWDWVDVASTAIGLYLSQADRLGMAYLF